MKHLILIFLFPFYLKSQVVITSSGSSTTDFNTLANTGSTNAWVNNSTIANWYAQRTGTGTTYAASTGSTTTGDLYSFGIASAADRALGSLGSGNASAGSFAYGQLFQNTSGNSISDIKISYTGEQWRNSAAVAQTVSFYYKISSTTISNLNPNSNGTWIPVAALNFTSPVTGGGAGLLNGNLTANKTSFANISIPCLELKNNEYLMIKWDDPDHTGTDHGLSIDDVTVTWTVASTCDAVTNISLAGTNKIGLRNLCALDGSGWVYYSDKCTPNQLLFGIKKNGNTFDASVDLTVGSVISKVSSNGINQEHGMSLMGRYWNVTVNSGAITTPVDVRFFYDPTELTDAKTDRDNNYALIAGGSTLAVTSGNTAEWFKNTNGVPFDASYISSIVGNKFPSSYIKFSSPSFSSINGVTYVELTGITSFSGGTGGYSYGPINPSGGNALPVTWGNINATAVSDGYEIYWQTLSEEKTKFFELESSLDGINFYSISSKIHAAGTSKELKNYSYNHKTNSTQLYYRIKQIDVEDNFSYSKTISANKSNSTKEEITIVPYLINGNLYVSAKSKLTTPLEVKVYDLYGKILFSKHEYIDNTIFDNVYDISNIANGRYIVQLHFLNKYTYTKLEKL
jgi:hypothetical protein